MIFYKIIRLISFYQFFLIFRLRFRFWINIFSILTNTLPTNLALSMFTNYLGTNGLYEAIYHAVPVLGMPLVVDQFDNMLRITGRGAGKTLDFADITEEQLQSNIIRYDFAKLLMPFFKRIL